jgi:hypothetical protein
MARRLRMRKKTSHRSSDWQPTRSLQPSQSHGSQAQHEELETAQSVLSATPHSRFSEDFSRLPLLHTRTLQPQPQVTIEPAGNRYEQEADRVAAQVVAQSAPRPNIDKVPPAPAISPLQRKPRTSLQRKTAAEEEKKKEDAQAKIKQVDAEQQEAEKKKVAEAKKVVDAEQNKAKEKEEEDGKVQRQPQTAATPTVTPAIERHLDHQPPGQPLPEATRQFMESRFQHNFSQVRIQTNPAAAQALNAKAFTQGSNIVFGAGQYQPHTIAGKRLLAHELTHVVQQGAAPTQGASLGSLEKGRDRATNENKH